MTRKELKGYGYHFRKTKRKWIVLDRNNSVIAAGPRIGPDQERFANMCGLATAHWVTQRINK